MLTAILTSFNEVHNEVFWANLKLLRQFADAEVEVLVIDGGSCDGTRDKLVDVAVRVLPDADRGARYNLGISLAQGDVILLVHPRSRLTREGLELLIHGPFTRSWGAFRHSFDWSHPLLKFTSWYSNFVRGRARGIFYLDHCLYFTADLKAHAQFPEVALFEDTYFCLRLKRVVWPKLLSSSVTTSAIRFRKNGVLRQSLLNQVLKIMFHFGASEKWMNRIYERGLSLNVQVKK